MAGLIQAQMEDPSKEDPTTPKTTTYDPERVQLDEQTDTVEGRVNRIIAQGSPLQTQAQTAAKQDANRRGLINSSMAVQAGQEATYKAALPIAQQDAATSYNAKTLNQAAGNTALNLGATGRQNMEQTQQQGIIQRQLQQGAGDIQSKLQAEKADIDLKLQSASAADAIELQKRKGEIDSQLQAQGGTIQSGLMNQKADIDLKLQTANAADTVELQKQKGLIDQQLQQIQIQGDMQKIKEQGTQAQTLQQQKGDIDAQLQTADAANREKLLAQQGALDYNIAVLKGNQTVDLTRQQGEIDRALQVLRGDQATALTGAQAEAEKGLIAARADADRQLETLKGELATQLQTLQGGQNQELARIDGDYKLLLQTSQSASVFYSQIASSVGTILADPKMKPDQKQQMVNKQLELLSSGLAVIGGTANVDLNGLLDTGGAPSSGQVYAPGTNGKLPKPGTIASVMNT